MSTVFDDDRSYLWGDGLFETIRIVNGSPWRIGFHVDRFVRSATALGFSDEQIQEGVSVIESVGGNDGLCRVTIPREANLELLGGSSSISVSHRLPRPPKTISVCSIANAYYPNDTLAELKSTSYLRSIDTRRKANARGFDCGIRISADGIVGEAAMSNLFAVIDGVLVTPEARGLIAGNVRAFLLHEMAATECVLALSDLERATEIFLTSVGVGAQSVSRLDENHIGEVEVAESVRRMLEW